MREIGLKDANCIYWLTRVLKAMFSWRKW